MAKIKPKNKEISLEDKLWETAEQLRGSVEVSEYKYIAMGLMFLKFISDRYEERRDQILKETKDKKHGNYCDNEKDRKYILNLKDQYLSKGVFYLKEGDRWSDLTGIIATEKNLGIKIDQMLSEIEKDNESLEHVLPKIFSGSTIPNQHLQQLIELFDSISPGTQTEIAKDTFGRIYEFFMKKFSKREGQKGGEFFTPESIVRLLVEIIEPYEGIIYDPTCGSGGMFVQSQKFLDAHENELGRKKLSVYGVEKQTGIWRICKMNLALRGLDSKNIKRADSLLEHPFTKLKANRVMANPPFNMREWGHDQLVDDVRFRDYGLPTASKAGGNYAFMEHMLYHLDDTDGRMGLVLTNGSMSAGGTEGKIREAIVRDDKVDCMVALPTNLFFTVTIPACLWFLTKNKNDGKTRKRTGETLFIDARKIFTKVDKILNIFSDEQIDKIAGTYHSFTGTEGYPKYKDIPGYCKVATIDEIEKNKFNLTPGAYVGAEDIEDDDELFEDKMKKLTTEYVKLSEESIQLDKEIRKNLKELGFEI
jgi:type I restriction enzyme M protein